MDSGKIDIETAVLAGLCSDRYLLMKALDDGFRPELLYSPGTKVLGTAMLHLQQESTGAIDLVLLKGTLEQQGLLVPEVTQLLETITKIPAPSMERLMAYLGFLKERWSREQL
jgi:hypothetical protein